jgi:hypothetical protein
MDNTTIPDRSPDTTTPGGRVRCGAKLHRVQGDGRQVLTHLLDRSGLLRMPVMGRIDFVHKTFQEYLAARAAVAADDTGILVAFADNDQWREVVLMAVSHARPQQTETILRDILASADMDSDHQRRYGLEALAFACLQYAPSVAPELRETVERRAAHLVPPRNLTHATAIASAGETALELLAAGLWPATIPETAASIRVDATVGGDHALELIVGYAQRKGRQIREELERAWSKFDPEEFAGRVLATVPALDRIRLTDPNLLPGLRFLELGALTCRFAHGYGHVDYLKMLPRLHTFRLRDPLLSDLRAISPSELESLHIEPGTGLVDIRPLGRCRTLRSLALPPSSIRFPEQFQVIDQVTSLKLTDTEPFVLRDLSDALVLERFSTSAFYPREDLTEFLVARPLAGVTSLDLGNLRYLRTIAGIEQWSATLKALHLRAPEMRDVSPLMALPRLEVLDLSGTPVDSLEFVAGLPGLRRLQLGDHWAPVPDLSQLVGHPTLERVTIVDDHWHGTVRLPGVDVKFRKPS